MKLRASNLLNKKLTLKIYTMQTFSKFLIVKIMKDLFFTFNVNKL